MWFRPTPELAVGGGAFCFFRMPIFGVCCFFFSGCFHPPGGGVCTWMKKVFFFPTTRLWVRFLFFYCFGIQYAPLFCFFLWVASLRPAFLGFWLGGGGKTGVCVIVCGGGFFCFGVFCLQFSPYYNPPPSRLHFFHPPVRGGFFLWVFFLFSLSLVCVYIYFWGEPLTLPSYPKTPKIMDPPHSPKKKNLGVRPPPLLFVPEVWGG